MQKFHTKDGDAKREEKKVLSRRGIEGRKQRRRRRRRKMRGRENTCKR